LTSAEGKAEERPSGLGQRLLDFFARSRPIGVSSWASLPGLSFLTPVDLLIMSAVSALCGTGVIVILNAEAHRVQEQKYSILLAVGFVVVLILYRVSQRFLIRNAARAIEDALHERRVRLADKVLKLDLMDTQALTRDFLVAGMARHYEAISQAIVPLLVGFQSVVLLCLMVAYLFWLSVIGGILTLVFAAVTVQGYLSRAAELQQEMKSASRADADLQLTVEEIESGFKELRLSPLKQNAIHAELAEQSKRVADHRGRCADIIGDLVTAGNSASYMLGSAVVFILPILSDSSSSDLTRIITTVLFLMGPLGGVVGAGQQLSTARFALMGLDQFERAIDARIKPTAPESTSENPFNNLRLRNVSFAYPASEDETGFGIRGIDLDIRAGEIVFVTGGNGSGKTTALRVLTGLYPAHAGSIDVNGHFVAPDRLNEYRGLFSTVFADFHAFRKPYGLEESGVKRMRENLETLDILQKFPADLAAGYDPQALSTGQRKRLALAAALAENRPVIVLDEWAADQDPSHRDHFYRTILPNLKDAGKAIIAVTHDERYFDLADRRYHMEDSELKLMVRS